MRALEFLIWMVLICSAPPVLAAMQIMPLSLGGLDANTAQAGDWIYNLMYVTDSDNLQQVSLTDNYLSWNTVTFALHYLTFGFFWILFLLTSVVLIFPALILMFKVPTALALWLSVGVWFMYMLAYIQIKRGGYSLDGYR